ncbi:MAG TPA: response regulator [Elusimicrobia bacterium]|nr:MAG: hypothetical protein A2X37_10495 [Elusimicrobia bacterium GWA2_66_18]OGR77204.1 MAG: hypothetical protein A2X40_00920 [Elusimicrobia bacterium GWC2_65_9]HAZ07411.1 response regulator [Elusimicrobiota bacterium]
MADILIVDDEECIRDLLKEVVTVDGHKSHLAASGTEAFDILRKKSIDLVLVDRNMPGMSGIEVVQLIRRNPKTAKMKVLMCTAASVTKEVEEAFAAGADDYILKPLNFSAVLGKVAKALACR